MYGYTTLKEARLADGGHVALVERNGEYHIQLGLTGKTVPHAMDGHPVPCTTHGCLWCADRLDLAEEAWNIVLQCQTVQEADRKTTPWWQEKVDTVVNW